MKILRQLLATIDKKSFIAYVIVGVITNVIYFCVFVLFFRWLHLHYMIAISIAYLLSLIFNFTANRFITFSNKEKQWHLHLMKYLCIAFFNYLVSLATVHAVVEELHLSPYFGIVAAIGMTVMSGYLFSKNWIYRSKPI